MYAVGKPTVLNDRTGLYPGEGLRNRLNSAEGRWCAARPHWWDRCAQASIAVAESFAAQRALYGDEETAESDAFRHCVWSACMTVSMGASTAKMFTDSHE